ncbi:MAG: hypothetical protein V1647_02085 [Pseudomonadota bacterium]
MKIKRFLTVLAVAVMFVGINACGGSDETPAPQPETGYDLLTDDGVGVIFTNYSAAGSATESIPAQFKFYNNNLRMILNGETFPGSQGSPSYKMHYEKFKLVIFGLQVGDTTVDKIVCEKSEHQSQQLMFDDFTISNNGDITYSGVGIEWQDLIDMQGVPVIEDREIPCSGGGKNFTVNVFKNYEISDDEFTLYFAFKGERKFRGKIVVTEEGKNPSTDGSILMFE